MEYAVAHSRMGGLATERLPEVPEHIVEARRRWPGAKRYDCRLDLRTNQWHVTPVYETRVDQKAHRNAVLRTRRIEQIKREIRKR